MESLKKQRAVVKGSMTKLLSYVRGSLDKASMDEVAVKQERAQKLLVEFMSIEREMFDLDSKVESDLSDFEDSYYLVLAGLTATIRKYSANVAQNIPQLDYTMNASHQQSIEVRLPKINIPTFDGNYMEWQSFFDIYSSTIHERDNLTAAQKFQYLRGLLKGEAASLIRHLSVTDANYNEAYQKLIQRYDRKRQSVNAFIRSYVEHPNILQPNAANIRKLTDTLDESIRGLKALGSDAEKRDPWLIYIALNKLDDETRALWAQETAERDFCDIGELFKFLEKRVDMLEAIKGYSKRVAPPRTPVIRACPIDTTTTTMPLIICQVCNEAGHKIYDCNTYKDMTVVQRSEAVAKSNRCFNCLNANHRVYECRSRARCRYCHRKHHTSLHEASTEIGSNKEYDENHSATVHKTSMAMDETTVESDIKIFNT